MPQIDLGQVVGAQGPQGDPGPQGKQGVQGPAGASATINGVNALTIEAGDNIELDQQGGTATLSVPTDATPTAGSTKPVQSRGVADALNAKPNKNLLDNWYFANPINQRDVSGAISEVGYFIDRWKLVSGSVTLTSTGITINGTISQILETAVGTNVTASALTTTGIVSASYDNASKTFTITGTGQTFVAAKLELGSAQSLAHQETGGNWALNEVPDYREELAKCQRYQVVIPTLDISGCTNNTTTLYANIPTPVPMRAIPSIENNGVFIARGNSTAQTNLTASTYSTSFTPQGIRVGITGEFSANVVYGVAINAQIILNANL